MCLLPTVAWMNIFVKKKSRFQTLSKLHCQIASQNLSFAGGTDLTVVEGFLLKQTSNSKKWINKGKGIWGFFAQDASYGKAIRRSMTNKGV